MKILGKYMDEILIFRMFGGYKLKRCVHFLINKAKIYLYLEEEKKGFKKL
jgi:hypothetical protein